MDNFFYVTSVTTTGVPLRIDGLSQETAEHIFDARVKEMVEDSASFLFVTFGHLFEGEYNSSSRDAFDEIARSRTPR